MKPLAKKLAHMPPWNELMLRHPALRTLRLCRVDGRHFIAFNDTALTSIDDSRIIIARALAFELRKD